MVGMIEDKYCKKCKEITKHIIGQCIECDKENGK